MHEILSADSSSPLWIEPLKNGKGYQVLNEYEIGHSMSHAEQPRWNDIYEWDGKKYSIANKKYPEHFAELKKELIFTLKNHPEDYEILTYRGQIDEIEGHSKQALHWYRNAERALSNDRTHPYDKEESIYLHKRMEEMRTLIRSIDTENARTQPVFQRYIK